MNRFVSFFFVFVLAIMLPAVSARADHPTGATSQDIVLLQDDLENLDDVLATLDPADSRTTDFRRRERQIQDRVVALRTQIERHRRNDNTGLGASKAVVDDLRVDIRSLQNDIHRTYAGRSPAGELMLPRGTQVHVRLDEAVSSRTARVEDRVDARVELPVRDGSGRVVIPAGSRVWGTVADVDRAQRPARGGEIALRFDSVEVGSQRLDMRSRLVSVDHDVDRGKTAKRAGIGAALGGLLGGILEGKTGALVGIVVGGAGGVVSSKGDDVELPAGTVVTVELDEPLRASLF
jgi:hypothetical protein